jgi:hypothetical protein
MGFLIFLGIILYMAIKNWKQIVKLVFISFILIFAFAVVKLKEAYDYLLTPTLIQTEQTISTSSNNQIDNGLVEE